jgi:succinyl-CoA synthetase beta subunit
VVVKLYTPVVVKAQIPIAGKGKAGGIIFADSPTEAELARRLELK